MKLQICSRGYFTNWLTSPFVFGLNRSDRLQSKSTYYTWNALNLGFSSPVILLLNSHIRPGNECFSRITIHCYTTLSIQYSIYLIFCASLVVDSRGQQNHFPSREAIALLKLEALDGCTIVVPTWSNSQTK